VGYKPIACLTLNEKTYTLVLSKTKKFKSIITESNILMWSSVETTSRHATLSCKTFNKNFTYN